MNLRPFRVNAGAVHSYVWAPENATSYLTELKAGSKVLCVDTKGNSREVEVTAVGSKSSFFEFTNFDDAGNKYLKKDGNLYAYSPDTEKIIPITGAMLKGSMMWSDMSYEDTVDNDTLESKYNASVIGEKEYIGKKCWVLELIGKKKTISYPKEKLWIDKENYNALKSELYALSGSKLKERTVLEIKKIGDRYFPVLMEMKDLLRKDSKTVFKMNNVFLDIKIPEGTFSMKNLEK